MESFNRYLQDESRYPDYELMLEDGVVTGVRLDVDSLLDSEKYLAVYAFLGAQPGGGIKLPLSGLLRRVQEPYQSYSYSFGGYTVRQDVTFDVTEGVIYNGKGRSNPFFASPEFNKIFILLNSCFLKMPVV